MKKLIIVLVLLLTATALFGQAANSLSSLATTAGGNLKTSLGTFPVGKWLDPNYDAVWEFTSDNIRILNSNNGSVYYDFSSKTKQDFKVFVDGTQPGISFSCPESERTYYFKANLTNGNVTMDIERSGQPKYTVTMKKQ